VMFNKTKPCNELGDYLEVIVRRLPKRCFSHSYPTLEVRDVMELVRGVTNRRLFEGKAPPYEMCVRLRSKLAEHCESGLLFR